MGRIGQSTKDLGIALLLATASAAALAQAVDGGGRGMGMELQKRFVAADANGDGKLTKDEAKKGMPFVYKHFDEIDTAKKGEITMADIAAFARAWGEARKAKTP
jgi:Ca2+-binding EF-hand superfamily protein